MSDEHDRHLEDIAAYALGALSELEAAAVERHMMRCETCAGELARVRKMVDLLPAAVSQHRASPELKQSIMTAVRQDEREPIRATERKPRRRPSWSIHRPAIALACAAVAAVAIVVGVSVSWQGTDTVVAAVDQARLPGAQATLTAHEHLGVLRLEGLPAAGQGRVYVVWVDSGRGPVYASSFNPRPDGAGAAGIASLDGVRRVMVTREPSTAVTQPSENPVVTVELS